CLGVVAAGCPVEDLALRAWFVQAAVSALHGMAAGLAEAGLGGIGVVTGFVGRREGLVPRLGVPPSGAEDAAALLHGGQVVVTTAKHHLPNYGVFDEYRYFLPGDRLPVFRLPCGTELVDVAIAVCED